MSSPKPSLPQLVIRRKRASTKTLLGSAYEDIITKIYDPLEPEKNAQDYNEARLKEGLNYADSALRHPNRKLSPLGMRIVYIYKNAITSLLDLEKTETAGYEDEAEEAKEEWLAIIRVHEESAQYQRCLVLTNSPGAQKLQDEIVNLQRIAFFARYGDFFAIACKQLRAQAEAQKVLGWRRLVGSYWTEIRDRLEKETHAWEQVQEGKPMHKECPTYLAIWAACDSVGFNTKQMLTIIELYAKRNEIMHSDMEILIKNGQYDDLKKTLYEDFCDIPRVISAVEGAQAELLTTLLEVIIDHWYIRNKRNPDNIQMWRATEELEAAHERLQNGEMKSAERKQLGVKITHKLAEKMREKDKDAVLNNQEYVALSELAGERKRAKDMNKAWTALINMSYGIRKLSDTYIANYGALERPSDIIHDPTLD